MKSSIAIVLFSTLVASTAIQQNAFGADLTPAQEGRKLFLKLNCYGCHGMRGTGGMGPRLIGESAEVSAAVLQGKAGGMRSFSEYVSDLDVANLSAYVGSLGTAEEPTFLHWWEDSPTE